LITLIGLVPGLLLWFFIHPFIGFWRKFGPGWTYAILSVPVIAIMVAVFRARRFFLAEEYGTNVYLIGLGALCLVCGSMISVKRRQYLTFGVLAGLPELSSDPQSQKLLTEGIYSRVRHPRYVELMFWLFGYTLIANYQGLYIATLISLPVLYLIVLLEEKELRERFGSEYEEYSQRVPRFIPKLATRG
jgi:protein-S-isoprenylcysteine O-methyltransferase Ste14